MARHVDFKPLIAPPEARTALLELSKDIRAVVSGNQNEQLDWDCRMTGAGIVLTRAGQLTGGVELSAGKAKAAECPACQSEEAAILLESAAGQISDDGTIVGEIDWWMVIQLIWSLVEKWLKERT